MNDVYGQIYITADGINAALAPLPIGTIQIPHRTPLQRIDALVGAELEGLRKSLVLEIAAEWCLEG